MNNVTLVGNLGSDPELKNLQNDKKLVNFSIATSDGYGDNKKTNWHNCTAFGKTAEIIAEHVGKGDKIAVNGSIDYSEYKEKWYTKILVNSFTFQNSKSDIKNSEPETISEEKEDDLPF